MMAFRTYSSELVDAIVNHPSVRPTIEMDSYRINSAPLVNDPHNVFVAGNGLVAMFIGQGAGAYLGHFAAIDCRRGRTALRFGQAALSILFEDCGGLLCRAQVPLQLPQAVWFVKRLGFTSLGADSAAGFESFIKEAPSGH